MKNENKGLLDQIRTILGVQLEAAPDAPAAPDASVAPVAEDVNKKIADLETKVSDIIAKLDELGAAVEMLASQAVAMSKKNDEHATKMSSIAAEIETIKIVPAGKSVSENAKTDKEVVAANVETKKYTPIAEALKWRLNNKN